MNDKIGETSSLACLPYSNVLPLPLLLLFFGQSHAYNGNINKQAKKPLAK
jgi:hypothetical protein